MWKYNNQAVGAPCRPLLCVIYISSIVYNTLCILTVLFNKTIWFLAFDTLFELIIIIYYQSMHHCYYICILSHFKSYFSLATIFITRKKKKKKKKIYIYIYIYIYLYLYYRALWNPFYFQIHFFLYSVLMVKLNFINQKACLILSVPNSVFHYFLDSILMVPLNFNNQKHLQLIAFIFFKKVFFFLSFFFQKYCTFKFFLLNKFW